MAVTLATGRVRQQGQRQERDRQADYGAVSFTRLIAELELGSGADSIHSSRSSTRVGRWPSRDIRENNKGSPAAVKIA